MQKDREKMIVGHTVVGEDSERENYQGFLFCENRGCIFRVDGCWTGGAVGVERPFLCFVNVNSVERAVGISTKVNAIVGCGSSSYKRCFRSRMIQLLLRTPWLHVWVGFDQEEVTEQDADQEYAGAYKIGEEIWKMSK